mmetsp:Transcript_134906/g.341281  ORF Transcript_134906/g.341281 Transcript_134906/m.341281 type:complete len:206 (-) Transcript_134906:1193-1810(-)
MLKGGCQLVGPQPRTSSGGGGSRRRSSRRPAGALEERHHGSVRGRAGEGQAISTLYGEADAGEHLLHVLLVLRYLVQRAAHVHVVGLHTLEPAEHRAHLLLHPLHLDGGLRCCELPNPIAEVVDRQAFPPVDVESVEDLERVANRRGVVKHAAILRLDFRKLLARKLPRVVCVQAQEYVLQLLDEPRFSRLFVVLRCFSVCGGLV